MATQRLTRSHSERMLFGVCGGLAVYLDLDVTLVRAAFVLLALAGGSGVLIYLIAALLIPDEREVPMERVPPMPDEPGTETGAPPLEETAVTEEMALAGTAPARETVPPEGTAARPAADAASSSPEPPTLPPPILPPAPPAPPEDAVDRETTAGRRRSVFGVVLIVLGLLILLGQYVDIWRWAWPIALIVLGAFLLFWERRA